jgi:two-component system OmpR family response regulator
MAAASGRNDPLQTVIPAVVCIVGHGSEDVTVAGALLRDRGHTVKGPMSVAALQAPDAERPDCIIADLRPPVELSAEMSQAMPRSFGPLALVITRLEDVDIRLASLRFGAVDMLIAPFETRELVERVELMLARRRRMRSPRVQIGDVTLMPSQRTVTRGGVTVTLTARELQVLETLILANGRTLSKAELVEIVWHGAPRTPNSVEAQVSAVRRKLDRLGVRLVHTVHGKGYVFRPPLPTGLKRG